MSGGSYEYLCIKDLNQIIEERSTVDRMSARLWELGYEKEAERTSEIALKIMKLFQEMEKEVEPLRPVWKAVEWLDSCDWREEQVKEAVIRYRSKNR